MIDKQKELSEDDIAFLTQFLADITVEKSGSIVSDASLIKDNSIELMRFQEIASSLGLFANQRHNSHHDLYKNGKVDDATTLSVVLVSAVLNEDPVNLQSITEGEIAGVFYKSPLTATDIVNLQSTLNANGANLAVDGIFGPLTANDMTLHLEKMDPVKRNTLLADDNSALVNLLREHGDPDRLAELGIEKNREYATTFNSVSTKYETSFSPEGTLILQSPVKGEIGDKYGPRIHPVDKVLKSHDGIDIKAGMGTPIAAPADAVVAHVGVNPNGYGDVVILYHGNDVYSLHAHLEKASLADLKEGQRLEAGESFANVGNSGKTTGPHLHTEIIIEKNGLGYAIDPQEAWKGYDLSKEEVRNDLIAHGTAKMMSSGLDSQSAAFSKRIANEGFDGNAFDQFIASKDTMPSETVAASTVLSNPGIS